MWRNWTGTEACVPAVTERPASTEQVARAVQQAAEAGRVVRVAGAGHSMHDSVCTDGTLLHLGAMDRVLEADRETGRVRVQAGITLNALSRQLLAHGLAMPNLGDIDVQSVAGAAATGTHGTGARLGNISTAITAVQLVDGGGEVHEIDGGDELLAARVSLGSLGVLTELTLQCVPAFRLHGVDEPLPLDEVLATLDERAAANDHFEFWTFPHSPVAITRTNNRTDAPPRPESRARRYVNEVLLENRAFQGLSMVARRWPRTIPYVCRTAGWAASRRERVDWSFEIFATERRVRFTEMEYAFPRERAREAVLAVNDILERHPVSFPLELRYVAADDALLSPAHGRDTAYIAVHAFVGMPYREAFEEVEAYMAGLGGRPHWGKRSFLGAGELSGRYPRWEDWQAVRARLDGEGRFANAWAQRVTGSTSLRRDRSGPPRSPAPL
jgi:L-gulono-1,4-lactone dehydrogenase